MSVVQQKRAELEALAATDPHRPEFHFVTAGWLNDPNGLTFHEGLFHLFYQYNPYAPVHHKIHWGHAVSSDLLEWEELPIALTPGTGPDEDGCWSGVLVHHDGVPTIMYSGRKGGSELPCLAFGTPDLTQWRKHPDNPVISAPPADLDIIAFRDHCLWQEGDTWRQVIGSGVRGVGGAALLYESRDLRSWTYLGPLLTGNAETNKGTPLWTGTMWECIDVFPLGDAGSGQHHIMVFSAWDHGVTMHTLYWVGQMEGDRFIPEGLHRLDLGGRFFYAPQSMRDEAGRRLMFGWLQEGRSDAAQIAAGWSGVMSLPRLVTARPDGTLHQHPAPEVDRLRSRLLFDGDGSHLPTAELTGDQLDVELDVTLPPGATLEVKVRATPDNAEQTVYLLEHTTNGVRLSLDRSTSSLDPTVDTTPLSGSIPSSDGKVSLRILVDHSALESFANGVPLTARAYPTRHDALGIGLRQSAGQTTARVWSMNSTSRNTTAHTHRVSADLPRRKDSNHA
ncbi:glycoside hydrolase family 32 protein [Tessaracoccus antarcticus]|uniref:beta-fructofuranosidase n=1 Tax=Tessaracoccus antarcticus TaxID=2479848 RepID=A0A3M0GJH1_9ACTN|nr:glycoside hydrolase family 32 protein [Tessaracoccus antarcticus]RMB61773.1 glycoside hydrolase family 32 protein [Tessaracoccus antarcticus]